MGLLVILKCTWGIIAYLCTYTAQKNYKLMAVLWCMVYCRGNLSSW